VEAATATDHLAEAAVVLKPRLELHVPSVVALVEKTSASHSGVFLETIRDVVREMFTASADGIDAAEARAIAARLAEWSDTSLSAFIFAPDREGRLQWSVRVNWSVETLRERLGAILELEAAAELFEGLRLKAGPQVGGELALSDSTLAYLTECGSAHACVSSHRELAIPSTAGVFDGEGDEVPLIRCTYNLVGTEADSGATFLSSFSAVTDIEYTGGVDGDGGWSERVAVHWPPISGVGAKTLFGRVKQTFYVPEAAFGAMAIKTMMGPGMLDGMAGFGQQMVMDPSGEMTLVGEAGPGPLTAHAEAELCVTLLPGTGFLPAPDIIVQARTKRPQRLMEGIREATQKANEGCAKREWAEPWHEVRVRDRAVFFSDGGQQYPGVIMPLTMRPVLFTNSEVDAKDRERSFMVLGFTSTSPERLVRRWLDLPRSKDRRYLPEKRKTNGQLWVNWDVLYRWVSPYVNVPIGAVATVLPLPAADEVKSDMTDAIVTAKLSYQGLKLSHTGPVPIGALVVPALVGASTSIEDSGDSDLARERSACRRLKVLYHHAKLFKKDIGRWPAEVGELDGYVDFAGHPGLLHPELSSRKRWSRWFDRLREASEAKEEDEFEEEQTELDDDLFVIEWGEDSWRLKLAPGTLEHLEELYIDQDGTIHRREAEEKKEVGEISLGNWQGSEAAVEAGTERAAKNVADRYSVISPSTGSE
jgi:hypothetical protein